MRGLRVILACLFLCPTAICELVIPSDRVTNRVVARQSTSTDSADIGSLRPGDAAVLLDSSQSGWHQVRLTDGTVGFVSKAWTVVIADPVPALSAWKIYFLDVGTGDSAIIDMGDKEIVIDGGDSIKVLNEYATKNNIIDGPIELVVVTHADFDHWNGLKRLLGFDGVNSSPPAVLEFWEPGYDRQCATNQTTYPDFIANVLALPNVTVRRPLETTRPPATITGTPQPFTLPSLPGIRFTVLNTEANPISSNGDCAYTINNASIVLMIELGGFRFLFTGDANGKERNEDSPGTPGHIEAKLLALEAAHPGILKAHVIKAPHHGSETASTQDFINAVNPAIVMISASEKHHLPKETVIDRYRDGQRVILRTDETKGNNNDHIVCFATPANTVDCNYESVLND